MSADEEPTAEFRVLPFPTLSEREREVALLLVDGTSSREAAEKLEISQKTVDTHRSHIMKKLACRNNVDLARLAVREGYVAP